MAYGITRESQIIDLNSIERGCAKLQEAAERLIKCGQSVANISEICDTNALSANGKSMVPVIEEKGNTIVQTGNALAEYATSLQTAAKDVYRIQYNEYASYLDEQKNKDGNN